MVRRALRTESRSSQDALRRDRRRPRDERVLVCHGSIAPGSQRLDDPCSNPALRSVRTLSGSSDNRCAASCANAGIYDQWQWISEASWWRLGTPQKYCWELDNGVYCVGRLVHLSDQLPMPNPIKYDFKLVRRNKIYKDIPNHIERQILKKLKPGDKQ